VISLHSTGDFHSQFLLIRLMGLVVIALVALIVEPGRLRVMGRRWRALDLATVTRRAALEAVLLLLLLALVAVLLIIAPMMRLLMVLLMMSC
jgi:hypothetical protein